jgi:hypothetical protein
LCFAFGNPVAALPPRRITFDHRAVPGAAAFAPKRASHRRAIEANNRAVLRRSGVRRSGLRRSGLGGED